MLASLSTADPCLLLLSVLASRRFSNSGTDDTADREAVQAEVIRGLPLAESPLDGGVAGGLVPPGPVPA